MKGYPQISDVRPVQTVESHVLEVSLRLISRSVVDDLSLGDDSNLVEELVDLISSLVW